MELLVGRRINTERVVQTAVARFCIKSERKRSDKSQQPRLPFTTLEGAYGDDRQHNGKNCANESVTTTNICFSHTSIMERI